MTTNSSSSQGNITFENIAVEAGIAYTSIGVPSRETLFAELTELPAATFEDFANRPIYPQGLPGLAILDYDKDGDLDIYVANGPGTPNSLYSNQFEETGLLRFVDVAEAAGVAATDQESSGVAYGDINNDGYHDLLVLGVGEANRLFLNQGDGTFVDITETSGIGGGDRYSTSASMGDVNGDGLLDIVVANTFTNWDNQIPIFIEPFARNEHNQLFINNGNNVFTDVSSTSGIENLAGFPEDADGAASITWAIGMVDYNLDGYIDIIHADDQAGFPTEALGGVDRGFVRILQNDGTGHFTDVTVEANTNIPGSWMGLAFGDFNSGSGFRSAEWRYGQRYSGRGKRSRYSDWRN